MIKRKWREELVRTWKKVGRVLKKEKEETRNFVTSEHEKDMIVFPQWSPTKEDLLLCLTQL